MKIQGKEARDLTLRSSAFLRPSLIRGSVPGRATEEITQLSATIDSIVLLFENRVTLKPLRRQELAVYVCSGTPGGPEPLKHGNASVSCEDFENRGRATFDPAQMNRPLSRPGDAANIHAPLNLNRH